MLDAPSSCCGVADFMVVLSLEEYANLTDDIEMKLDEADRQAAMTEERISHETVFSNVRSTIHGK